MQLFCVSYRVPSVDQYTLGEALRRAGDAFPELANGEAWAAGSSSGEVVLAALHDPDDRVGPRAYRAYEDGVVVAFDGWPVHRRGSWAGHDAAKLLTYWAELRDLLEGQFSALRVDLATDDVSFLTDTFGIAPLYHLPCQGGHLVANSVEVLRLIRTLEEPSALGVSSFALFGWPTGETTLLDGVRALGGGSEYRLGRNGLQERPYFRPADLAAEARSGRRIQTRQAAEELAGLTAAAVEGGVPVECGLTAGRDTRLLLALLLAAGADQVRYFTGGREGDSDLGGARRIAAELALNHELRQVDVLDARDPRQLVKTFVSQTDGLSSLIQIGDFHDQAIARRPLGVKLTGLGGEIGRGGVRTSPFAATVPPFTFSARLQEKLILERTRGYERLVRPESRQLLSAQVRAFGKQRLAEGWKRRELGETHYAFDRVARWGSTGMRRLAATDDLFSPYCSRDYARYCFSLSPQERYLEAAHYRLLSVLSPTLRDLDFSKPWRSQERKGARLRASSELANSLLHRGSVPSPAPSAEPYWVSWFEAHLQEQRERCLSLPESPLWSFLDRGAVEAALYAQADERARLREGLVRVLTMFWYFHWRHVTPSAPVMKVRRPAPLPDAERSRG